MYIIGILEMFKRGQSHVFVFFFHCIPTIEVDLQIANVSIPTEVSSPLNFHNNAGHLDWS